MTNSPSAAWLPQVENARSVAELVRVLRDYLSSLTPEEAAQLPDGCAAGSISGAAEIQNWAVTLAHGDLKSSGSAKQKDALHQAAIVFAAAGTRLARVAE